MNCLNPVTLKTPESRLLIKCIAEKRPFEYYYSHSNARRNLLLDPTPICLTPDEYYTRFDYKGDLRYTKVPCGHCDNCIKRKVNDYFVRNYFEWCRARVYGSSWLITLTYADALLPRLVDGTPCFNSEDILLFLKRFRRLIEKLAWGDFSYFIVSEYGGEFGRPHYHALFHFTNLLSSLQTTFKLKDFIARAWTRVRDRQSWYANTELDLFDMQRVDVRPIESSKGISYACKYIGKQIGSEGFDNLPIPSQFKRRHWQSQGLGLCMYDYIDASDIEDGKISIDGYKYALPMYFVLKLKREFYCFHENGSIIYQPTDYAYNSCAKLTFDRLEQYKKLSFINDKFPKCPSSLNDPYNLSVLKEFLYQYGGLYVKTDFSGADLVHHDLVQSLIDDFTIFCNEVDLYYKDVYEAQAFKYRKQQNDRYLEKIGMRKGKK